jgi:hypothetical protein
MTRAGFLPSLGIVLLGAAVSASGGAKVPAVASQWAASPLVIDGQGGDWGGYVLAHDQKSGAAYAFRNDGGNLYVLVVLEDPEAAQAFRATGLKVFGRPGRSGAPGSGVLFLVRQVPTETFIGWREKQGQILTQEEKAELRKTPAHEVLLTFAVGEKESIYGPIQSTPYSPAPGFAVAEREGETTFEFRIPLASPKDITGAIGARPGETLRVSFDWGGQQNLLLSTPATATSRNAASGYLTGTGRTWAQEFLDTFDTMARPSSGLKKYSFSADVKLAASR